ncbi:MAG: polysaccharide pyruvyl transferase CsaB, partial [Elusimicrobiota bacterium]
MAKTDRIVLAGYYGYSNAGDELILKSLLKGVKQYIPYTEIIVLCRRGGDRYENTSSVKYIDRYDPVSIIKALACSHTLVMGGGSLIQDVSGIFTIYYYLILMAVSKV